LYSYKYYDDYIEEAHSGYGGIINDYKIFVGKLKGGDYSE
jgi:hypothetical protein